MTSNSLTFTRESHPQMFLPEDPFPYPFEGAKPILRDFLKVVRENPAYVECTHAAAYRLVMREGVDYSNVEENLRLTGKEIPSYPGLGPFYGVDEFQHDFVTGYLYQAAMGGRARKKAATVTGAPGAGKSDLINNLQYVVMHKREPIPFIAGSPMWSNPLNALFLLFDIAARKTARRRDAMLKELTKMIDDLDFSDGSALDFDNKQVLKIKKKHGFKANQKLTSKDLANVVLKSQEDFVSIVVYGLGLPKATRDALVKPDPWVRELVMGEFFGCTLIDADVAAACDLADKQALPGKTKKDKGYGQFDANYAVELYQLPLDNMFMSEGHGIVDVSEVQPINFDTKEWYGEQDIGSLGLYSDRDPRTVSLSGAFNRGRLLILTEGFRNPDEAFRVLLEALEGQRLALPAPLKNFWQHGVGWEGMIILHSNDEQWNKFYQNPDHRAHNDRLDWRPLKYPLQPSKRAMITEKLYGGSQFSDPDGDSFCHLEPLTFQYTGKFCVASHIHWDSKRGLGEDEVLRAYDGEVIRQPGMGTELNPRTLREMAPWTEGLEGISPREMDSWIGELCAKARREFEIGKRTAPCVVVAELRDHIISKVAKDPRIENKHKQQLISWLQGFLERKVRRPALTKVYKAAFIENFADLCQQFFIKYLGFLRAISRGRPAAGYSGGQYLTTQQMEQFLQEIERADSLQINSAQADKFRTNVLVAVDAYKSEHGGEEPRYDVHEGLRRCIEAYVLRTAKDITGVVGVSDLSPEEERRLNNAKTELVKNHGYCRYCAEKLVVEVAMTRDFLTN